MLREVLEDKLKANEKVSVYNSELYKLVHKLSSISEEEKTYLNEDIARDFKRNMELLTESLKGISLMDSAMTSYLIDLEGAEFELNNKTKVIHKLTFENIRDMSINKTKSGRMYEFSYQLKDKETNQLDSQYLSYEALTFSTKVEEVQKKVLVGILGTESSVKKVKV